MLTGYNCAFHLAAPGSNSDHNIFAFPIDVVEIDTVSVIYLIWEKNENKQKEAGIGTYLKQHLYGIILHPEGFEPWTSFDANPF